MSVDSRWGTRGKPPTRPQLSPEQLAANRQQAMKWREEWRAECWGSPQPPTGPDPEPPPKPGSDELKHRVKFAEGITRLEFGRAYWDKRRQSGPKEPAKQSLKSRARD